MWYRIVWFSYRVVCCEPGDSVSFGRGPLAVGPQPINVIEFLARCSEDLFVAACSFSFSRSLVLVCSALLCFAPLCSVSGSGSQGTGTRCRSSASESPVAQGTGSRGYVQLLLHKNAYGGGGALLVRPIYISPKYFDCWVGLSKTPWPSLTFCVGSRAVWRFSAGKTNTIEELTSKV